MAFFRSFLFGLTIFLAFGVIYDPTNASRFTTFLAAICYSIWHKKNQELVIVTIAQVANMVVALVHLAALWLRRFRVAPHLSFTLNVIAVILNLTALYVVMNEEPQIWIEQHHGRPQAAKN